MGREVWENQRYQGRRGPTGVVGSFRKSKRESSTSRTAVVSKRNLSRGLSAVSG